MLDLEFHTPKNKVFQAQDLGVLLADTHTHLFSVEEPLTPAITLMRAYFAGVAFVCPVADPSDEDKDAAEFFERLCAAQDEAAALIEVELGKGKRVPAAFAGKDARELLPEHVRVIAGVHPHHASQWNKESRERLIAFLEDERTGALGEIGLDYYYDFAPREVQRTAFIEQLTLAKEYGLPVDLHIRDAHDEAYEILHAQGLPEAGCVLHCFTLDSIELMRFAELGCVFSIGGAVTFNKLEELRSAVATAPRGKAHCIMTETDAPYMAPTPLRGTQCEPAMIAFTAAQMAACMADAGEGKMFLQDAYDLALRIFDTPRVSGNREP